MNRTPRFFSVLTIAGAAASVALHDGRSFLAEVYRPLAPGGAGEFLLRPYGWPTGEYVVGKLGDVATAIAHDQGTWEEHRDVAKRQRREWEEARRGR